MEFLKNKGFTKEEIAMIVRKYYDSIDTIEMISDNIEDVIDYFDSYGIRNIPKLMYNRLDIFYIPVDKLMEIFSHYSREYIIDYLDKDPAIFDDLN